MYFQQELFPYFSLFIQLFISTPKSNTTISAIVLSSDISHKNQFFSYLGIPFALSSVKTKQ